MKKLLAAGAVGAALFAGLVAPGTASAAPTPAAVSAPPTVLIGGRCEDNGFVRVNTSAVYIYALANTNSARIAVANRGTYLSCYKIIIGEPYRLCGATRPANGYIPVDIEGDVRPDGYVPSTCVTD